jgi:YfiH family protein
MLMLRQVHGRTVAIVHAGFQPPWRLPEADAIVTNDCTVALVVRVADCAPILLADRRTGAVAAIHAGWRSTMQRIATFALSTMRDTFGTDPADVVAAVGPSLGACCGEMGEEVVDAFRSAGHDAATVGRWFLREPGRRPQFDLWRANREQLEDGGVPSSAIHLSGLCTRSHPEAFHSYRASGHAAGRMAAVIRASQPPSTTRV